MNNYGTFTNLRPLSLLRHLSSCSDSTCLQTLTNSVSWSIFLDQGNIIYATHSIEPFDRLERHLRRLSHRIPTLTSEIRVQLRLIFEPDPSTPPTKHYDDPLEETVSPQLPPEYQAICWLISHKHVNPAQAAVIIQELVKEVIESFLLIKIGSYELISPPIKMPIICRFDVGKILAFCQHRLQKWQSLAPQISSPYQRPYLRVKTTNNQNNLPEIQQNLTQWMKGFSLRHLAVLMNQDELQIAKNLHPYVLNGAIVLHEPDPPFDQLPKIFEPSSQALNSVNELVDKELVNTTPVPITNTESSVQEKQIPHISSPNTEEVQELITPANNNTDIPILNNGAANTRKKHKIVSVDDSPTFLREISRFLEKENFSVITISNPVQAVMTIIRHKPDLILLDLNMEGIDGYELCRIIRHNSLFKNTPIVMVTGNKGIVDKVRARLVGASGYLTKPFTRADLLKILFMHLA